MHKIRTEITKDEEIRYISHLDYASALERAIRRAKLPVAYSEGFNPHMKISFASALAVGVTSAAEYMDIEFKTSLTVEEFCEKFAAELPPGITLLRAKEIVGKQTALMAVVDLAVYEVKIPFTGDFAEVRQAVLAYNQAEAAEYTRISPKGRKTIEIKQYMAAPIVVQCEDAMLFFDIHIKITPQGSIKPGEILKVLTMQFALPVDEADAFIHRSGLYTLGRTPMDL